jgi:hypothetical protein
MRFPSSTDVLQTLGGWLRRGASILRAIGPYAAIELLLPGGSLMALALWLARRGQLGRILRRSRVAESTVLFTKKILQRCHECIQLIVMHPMSRIRKADHTGVPEMPRASVFFRI